MDISFVLLTWNSEQYIQHCLDSLISDLDKTHFSYEIYIVDNASKDKTIPIINTYRQRYPENIIPIFLKANMGTTFSRNIALREAKGEFIVIMDSDIELTERTIEHLIEEINKDDKIGILAPQLIYSNGKFQKSTDVFPTIFTKIFRYFFLKAIEKRENKLKKHGKVQEVDYAISAMWVMKSEVLKNVGLFDENIFYAPEDVDYCLRLWLSGYNVIYDRRVSVIHHAQEISRGFKINKAAWKHIKGLSYYFKKHRYIFRPPSSVKKRL